MIALSSLHKIERSFPQRHSKTVLLEPPFAALLSWSWSLPLQATSAPRLSLALFLFLKFLLPIKKKKKENHIAIPSFPRIIIFSSELILRVILTLSSHWASSDANGLFQLFLHFIFVLTCIKYKYRTKRCNSGLKMQTSSLTELERNTSLLGTLIASVTCSELSKAQRGQVNKETI